MERSLSHTVPEVRSLKMTLKVEGHRTKFLLAVLGETGANFSSFQRVLIFLDLCPNPSGIVTSTLPVADSGSLALSSPLGGHFVVASGPLDDPG